MARLLFLVSIVFSNVGLAAQNDLLTRINEYRSEPGRCDGTVSSPADPLRADERLQRIQLRPDMDLQAALREVDYQAGAVQVITMTGPGTVRSAMAALNERFCDVILDAQFADLGIARTNRTWQLVLARPLVGSDIGNWREAGRDILNAANEARGEARYCGGQRYEAAGELAWSSELAQAAYDHSADMAERNYFAHQGRDGSSVSDRAEDAGYRWRLVGENLAAGSGSAEQAVQGWLNSPGHCANLMNPRFTEMGAAYAVNSASDAYIYWTQVLAAPR